MASRRGHRRELAGTQDALDAPAWTGPGRPRATPAHVSCSSLGTQLKSLGGRAHALWESQKHMTRGGGGDLGSGKRVPTCDQ